MTLDREPESPDRDTLAGWILDADDCPIFHVPLSGNAMSRQGIVPLPPG